MDRTDFIIGGLGAVVMAATIFGLNYAQAGVGAYVGCLIPELGVTLLALWVNHSRKSWERQNRVTPLPAEGGPSTVFNAVRTVKQVAVGPGGLINP